MIKNEEYMDYLSKVISCVSQGDYYSVKELSVLKLDNLKKETTCFFFLFFVFLPLN